jgi:hypothetical protein
MKTDTDSYEQIKKKERKRTWKTKKGKGMTEKWWRTRGNKKENNKEDTKQNKQQKQTSKRRKPVHPIKEMNEKFK